MIVDPVHGQRAAVHEHNHYRLAGRDHAFNECFLGRGQIDAGAVAAQESRLAHRHLFAFKLAGDAHGSNHDIGSLCGSKGFR